MSPQEKKKQHQALYQQEVDAVRNGRKPANAMVNAPRSIKQCQKPVIASFF